MVQMGLHSLIIAHNGQKSAKVVPKIDRTRLNHRTVEYKTKLYTSGMYLCTFLQESRFRVFLASTYHSWVPTYLPYLLIVSTYLVDT